MRTGRWLVAGMVLLGAAAAYAQTSGAEPEGGRKGPMGMRQGARNSAEMPGRVLQWLTQDAAVQKDLGLSDEQVANLHKQTAEMQRHMANLRTNLEQSAVDQVELIRAENPDEAALMKAVEKADALRTEIAKLEIKHLLAVRNILTAEQRLKLRERVKTRLENMKEQRGLGANRRGPMAGGAPGAPAAAPQPAPVPPPETR